MIYAGAVTPRQAWGMLETDPKALLVDVRSMPEWAFVGVPDLSDLKKPVLKLSWRVFPSMQENPDFISDLQRQVADKDTPLLFICRTGGRSHEAAMAMAEAGYTHCYNVLDGFEGNADSQKHRGTVSGWKAEGLAWEQN